MAKPFCVLSLATMPALEQVSVINDLKEQRNAGTEKRQSNKSAMVKAEA